MNLPMGTKSLLFGAHQFILHPIFVAIAWTKLHGFPKDIRLWFAFVVHDWGYWGSPNMDGPEGQRHPELGARIMGWLFGPEWASFTSRHSRAYAKLENLPISDLCNADKLATVLVPFYLYVAMVWLTSEWEEYATVEQPLTGVYGGGDLLGWARNMRVAILKAVYPQGLTT
jgi:hypothetical protein